MTAASSTLLPIVLYLALSFVVALWAGKLSRKHENASGFLEEYFLGSRSMGGFVLAMTVVASYTSASSFIGGPGVAYTVGLSWVLLAMIQMPTVFLTIGVLGKRFAMEARAMNAVTITGYPYEVGLALFGITVIAYTALGGFRAVVLTDAMQGIVMTVASVVVLLAVVQAGGGMEACMLRLKAIDPGLITPTGPKDAVPQPMILSFWVLVGLGVLGLPQTSQRCMGYKDSRAMHSAMIMGTVIIGFLLLSVHLAGALGRAVIPGLAVGDMAMPSLILELLPPFWAGVFIAGPLAAIMSTVDSMLLLASAAIIKDLYVQYVLKGDSSRMPLQRIKRFSLGCTAAIGAVVFMAALEPPDLLVWINLFAFGGLEATFLWPLLLGLYWRKANAAGALSSILVGVACFFALSVLKPSMYGIHAIVPSTLAALLAFLLGNRLGTSRSA